MNSSIVAANGLPVENAKFPQPMATMARDLDAKCVIFTHPFEVCAWRRFPYVPILKWPSPVPAGSTSETVFFGIARTAVPRRCQLRPAQELTALE